MLTRKEYLDDKTTDRMKLHRAYYGQFVTEGVKQRVLRRFPLETLRKSFERDKAFNTPLTPLSAWDAMLPVWPADVAKALREAGDYPTLGGAVCLLKEAARQILEEKRD